MDKKRKYTIPINELPGAQLSPKLREDTIKNWLMPSVFLLIGSVILALALTVLSQVIGTDTLIGYFCLELGKLMVIPGAFGLIGTITVSIVLAEY